MINKITFCVVKCNRSLLSQITCYFTAIHLLIIQHSLCSPSRCNCICLLQTAGIRNLHSCPQYLLITKRQCTFDVYSLIQITVYAKQMSLQISNLASCFNISEGSPRYSHQVQRSMKIYFIYFPWTCSFRGTLLIK